MEKEEKMRGMSRSALVVYAVLSVMLAGTGDVRAWETDLVHAPTYPEWVGQHVSVAVDPVTGRTVIAFYESYNEDLWLAREVGAGGNCGPDNSFYCGILDSAGDVGKHSSVDVITDDVATRITVSYHDATNAALKVAWATHRHDGVPVLVRRDTVQSGSAALNRGLYTSLKLDSNHRPHVSFQGTALLGNETLWHAQFLGDGTGNCGAGAASGDWQCTNVDSGEGLGLHTSLAISADGYPKIAYYDSTNGHLKYAFRGGLGWAIYAIDTPGEDTGRFASLYLDGSDRPHFAYYNATDQTVEYATQSSSGNCGGGAWQCVVIEDAGAECNDVAIVKGANGLPFIVHHNRATSDHVVRMAKAVGMFGNCGPGGDSWYCAPIQDPAVSYYPGMSLAVARQPTQGLVVAYSEFHVLNGYLKIAHDIGLPSFRDGFELGSTTLWSSVAP
jgi:hypothetical protein